jgi:hypothetical protein
VGAIPRASVVATVIAKTFAVVVRFMIISFACQFELWLGF